MSRFGKALKRSHDEEHERAGEINAFDFIPRTVTEADIGIDPDLFTRAFDAPAGASKEDEFNKRQNRRPVTVIPELRNRFMQDPAEAVKNNVGVHHRPEQIDAIQEDVVKIAEAHQRQEEIANKLWENDDFELLQLVKGLTRDNTLLNREVNSFSGNSQLLAPVGAGPRNIGLLQASGVADIVAKSREAGPNRFIFNTPQMPLPENATREQIEQYRREVNNIDRLRILENVDKIMEPPHVSGILQFSSVMFGSLNEALAHLAKRNLAKFSHKTRKHFYPDFTVKMIFAELISTLILYTKVIAPNQYYKEVDEPRRQRAMLSALVNMDVYTVWDDDRECFTLAMPKQVDKAKRQRRQQLLEAYSIDNTYDYE